MLLRILLTSLLISIAQPTWAARPFVTDDARLTTAGSCQLESWTRIYRDYTEYWALPACNPTGNLEFTAGGGVTKYNSPSPYGGGNYVFQLKTLYKELETNSYGIGLAAGTLSHPSSTPGSNDLGNYYAYIPYSVSFADDTLITHVNMGYTFDKASKNGRTLYGFGAEVNIMPRLMIIAETFGDTGGNPYWQSGLRFSIIPNLFQMDATLGQQFGNNISNRWISFGLRFTPASIF